MPRVMNSRLAHWFYRGCLMTIVALATILIFGFDGVESQATVSQALDSAHLATEFHLLQISAPQLGMDSPQVSDDGCVVWEISSKLGIGSQPTLSAEGNRIAFWSTGDLDPEGNNIDGNIELFVAEILTDTSSITPSQVTSSTGSILGGFNIAPSISADGSHIAFFSDRDLTGENRDGSFEVFLYNITAGTFSQVTQSRMGINILPSIDAEGSCIAFASDQNFAGDNSDDNLEIFLYDADNEPNPFSQVTVTDEGINDSPSLSADGTHVAFVTTSEWEANDLQNPDGNAEIFLYNTYTHVFTQVTYTEGGINEQPAINATGTRIVFVSDHDFTGENGDGNREIFMYETDVGEYVQISDTEGGGNSYPSINAEGDLVVYAFNQGSVGQILLYDTIARNFLRLDELDQGVNSHPTISAGGLEVAYVHDREILLKRCPTSDLTLDKSTGNVTRVLAGAPLTYTFTIVNNGPLNARSVRLIDPLPPELTYITATLSQGSCQDMNGTVICGLGSMPPTSTAGITLTVAVDPMARVSVVNTATVEASGGDSVPEDNIASVTTMVDVEADLWLVKSCAADWAIPGELLTYTLTITNIGPSGATGITLTDILPTTSNGPGGVIYITDTLGCDEVTTGTVICNLDEIVTDQSATVVITALVEDDARGQIFNRAWVESVDPDPVSGNNVSNVLMGVYAETDLSLVKTTAVTEVIAGTDLTYNLTVTNLGPQFAFDVQLTDDLPDGVTFDSASPGCSHGNGTVTCDLGNMSNGERTTVDIHVVVDPATRDSVTNTATVASLENDPDLSNNTAEQETPVQAEIDLVLAKTDNLDPVDAGGTLIYDLTVYNDGPSDATGVQLVDHLPTEVDFESASSGCNHSGGIVTCTLDTVDSGSNAAVDIHVVVSSTARGIITNTASVTGTEFELDTSDNQASQETAILGRVNLTISKLDNPDPVQAGGSLTYTIEVVNHGPSDATGVRVTDTLPVSVTFDSASAGCNHADGVVICNLGILEQNTTADVTILVTVDPEARGALTNEAIVGSIEEEQSPPNNYVSVDTDVAAEADLAVAKTDEPDPVIAGEVLTYTLTVINYGPATAINVELTDNLPVGVQFNSASPGCNHGNGVVVCDLGDIDVGSSVDVDIYVTVYPWARGIILNNASVESVEDDPNPGNNDASEGTYVGAEADLAIVKTDDPDPVGGGGMLTYTLTATNYGPSRATAIVLTDVLPVDVTFDSASPGCYHTNGVVVCNRPFIGVGGSVDVDIYVTVDLTVPGTIMNQAIVAAAEDDPNMGNNDTSEDTDVEIWADLAVAKTDDPDPVLAGEVLTYTLTVTNYGPYAATNVQLIDDLPVEALFSSASPGCIYDTGQVICNLGDIDVGSSVDADISVTVYPWARGTITNEASVESVEDDPNPGNNNVEEDTEVEAWADLAVAKTDDPDPVLAGEVLTYTLTVTNYGPHTATNVQLIDNLPVEALFSSASSGCNHTNGVVVCDLGNINAGNSVDVDIYTTVDPTTITGTITNQATVAAIEGDPDLGNNIVITDTMVNNPLVMNKTLDSVASNYNFDLTNKVIPGDPATNDRSALGATPVIAPTIVSGSVTVESLLLYLPVVAIDDSFSPGVTVVPRNPPASVGAWTRTALSPPIGH